MAIYRYVGNSETTIGTALYNTLGDILDTDEETANHHIAGGAAFLNEKEWGDVGITPEEVKLYNKPGKRVGAPEDFMNKMRAAWKAVSLDYMRLNGLDENGQPLKAADVGVEPVGAPVIHLDPVTLQTNVAHVGEQIVPAVEPQTESQVVPEVASQPA